MDSHHHFRDRFTEVSLSGNSVMAQGSHTLFTLKHFSLMPVRHRRSWRVSAQLGCFIRLAGLSIFSCQSVMLFHSASLIKYALNFQLVRTVLVVFGKIHFTNNSLQGASPDDKKVNGFEDRYRAILLKAKEEYEYVPASEYYKDGYNLYLRMEEYMSNHLLFLHAHRVPTTNNESERLLRQYKRKQQQAVTFRRFESIEYLCQCMSMLIQIHQNEGANLFSRVSQIFG